MFELFEKLFQAFVRRGGLDETRVVAEEIELLYRGIERHVPEVCRHGKTFITCGECDFEIEKRKDKNGE
jgi:hypothetical protein